MATSPEANAGVRFPPPFVFLLGLIAALLLNRSMRLSLVAPEPVWMFRTGIALILAGLALAAWGMTTFRRHHTAIIPYHPATLVVSTGPYAFTRNPMYLGMTILYIGGGLLLDTLWAFMLLPVVVMIIDHAVIRREERYLSSAFGAAYDAYRARVRRWL
jgi:protein-S-isoprenylcysteine O-methyltransferase Ste14